MQAAHPFVSLPTQSNQATPYKTRLRLTIGNFESILAAFF